MALLTCKDCGNRISDAAALCPKCGRPAPTPEEIAKDRARNNNAGIGCIVILIAVSVWMVAKSLVEWNAPPPERPVAQRMKTPAVTVDPAARAIEIENRDKLNPLRICRVALNSGLLIDRGFEAPVREVLPRSKARVPLRDFADARGVRFDVATMKVRTVSVDCADPDGSAWSVTLD